MGRALSVVLDACIGSSVVVRRRDGPKWDEVALFQPVVAQYRIEFLNALHAALDQRLVIFSEPPSAASGFIDLTKQLGPPLFPSKTYTLGPLWLVPRVLRESCIGRSNVIVMSWNVRQAEILVALVLAKLRGKRTVLWGHGVGRSGSRLARSLRCVQARLADAVVTYSEAGREEMVTLVTSGTSVHVAPNTTGRPPPRREDVLARPSHRVGYIGRLHERKRLDRLLRALWVVRQAGLELTLEVTGSGQARRTLEDLAESLGLQSVVMWRPATSDWSELRRHIARLDLVVFPEIAGLGVVDAMAAARPSVVLDDPQRNPPEMENVIDGVTGLRYREPTVESLAETIMRGYREIGLLQRLSEGAAAHYARHLSIDRMVCAFARAVGGS